jgi:hypothetical protein
MTPRTLSKINGKHAHHARHAPILIFFKKKVGENGGKWGKMFNFVA